VKGAAATVGAGFWVGNQRTYAQSKSPNEKLQIAWVGVGGKGKSDVDHAGQIGQVVAICDVDGNTLASAAEKFPDAEQFADYRELIEKMGDKVDAVGVSTPDHTHYAAAMLAMNKGKHVYCQKPLTYSIWEARQLRETAKAKGVKTQMGNQGSATDGLRKGVEWIRGGVIGRVKEIHVWTNRPIWPQAPKVMSRPPEKAPPKHLEWNLWLGPATTRPYAEYEDGKGAYHPFNWRGWWDFGTGALGDMACHTANLAFKGAQIKFPASVRAECGDLNPETFPSWAKIEWDFPAADGKSPIKFYWYEGKRDGKLVQPDRSLFPGVSLDDDKNKLPASGAVVVGEKGTLFQHDDYGAGWKLLPEANFKDVKGPEPKLPRLQGGDGDARDLNMKKEWASAIRGEIKQAFSHFGYDGPMTEAILLGNAAIRMQGQQLSWDAKNLRFTNNDKANQYVGRTQRLGWSV
jgi:predicted dehydrogenase